VTLEIRWRKKNKDLNDSGKTEWLAASIAGLPDTMRMLWINQLPKLQQLISFIRAQLQQQTINNTKFLLYTVFQ